MQPIFSNLGGQVHYLLQNVLADLKVLLVSALRSLSSNPVTEFKLLSDLLGTVQFSLLSQSLDQAPVRKMHEWRRHGTHVPANHQFASNKGR